MAKRVLDGAKPGDIDVNVLKDTSKNFQLWINEKTATGMGLTVTDGLRSRAAKVF
jgi:ABC-type uncharacterized transport system substrate-binding protein